MFNFWAGVCSVHVLIDRPAGTRVSGRSVIGRVIVFLYAHGSSSLGIMHPFGTALDCFFLLLLAEIPKSQIPGQITLHRAVVAHNI